MVTTDKYAANALAVLLRKHGVKDVVVSPGSRNAPIIVALERIGGMKLWPVIDERSAAFMAVGMSSMDGAPVALVCTSGSAVLNYAPAVAEAYYRMLPLVVVSADRPEEAIDQDDSQTIRQAGVLANIVKRHVDINDDDRPHARLMAMRQINDALMCALSGRRGPIHINIHLRAPLNLTTDRFSPDEIKYVGHVGASRLDTETAEELSKKYDAAGRVVIVAGHHLPSPRLRSLLATLAERERTTVVAEPVSNLWSDKTVPELNTLDCNPDLLITLGGSLVSKSTKEILRKNPAREHWHLGYTDFTIDTFDTLTLRIEAPEEEILGHLAAGRPESRISEPEGWNLQLSNGMSVRRAFNWDLSRWHRIDGNRGVSGIEGSTSTAIGLALADTERVTLLVSGDMSAAYDVGALSCPYIPPRFKMIVINNRGGEIFRKVATTRDLPELRRYIDIEPRLPLRDLACAYGFRYFSTDSEAIPQEFIDEKQSPCILEIFK